MVTFIGEVLLQAYLEISNTAYIMVALSCNDSTYIKNIVTQVISSDLHFLINHNTQRHAEIQQSDLTYFCSPAKIAKSRFAIKLTNIFLSVSSHFSHGTQNSKRQCSNILSTYLSDVNLGQDGHMRTALLATRCILKQQGLSQR